MTRNFGQPYRDVLAEQRPIRIHRHMPDMSLDPRSLRRAWRTNRPRFCVRLAWLTFFALMVLVVLIMGAMWISVECNTPQPTQVMTQDIDR